MLRVLATQGGARLGAELPLGSIVFALTGQAVDSIYLARQAQAENALKGQNIIAWGKGRRVQRA